jgi:hypothetical protein
MEIITVVVTCHLNMVDNIRYTTHSLFSTEWTMQGTTVICSSNLSRRRLELYKKHTDLVRKRTNKIRNYLFA